MRTEYIIEGSMINTNMTLFRQVLASIYKDAYNRGYYKGDLKHDIFLVNQGYQALTKSDTLYFGDASCGLVLRESIDTLTKRFTKIMGTDGITVKIDKMHFAFRDMMRVMKDIIWLRGKYIEIYTTGDTDVKIVRGLIRAELEEKFPHLPSTIVLDLEDKIYDEAFPPIMGL